MSSAASVSVCASCSLVAKSARSPAVDTKATDGVTSNAPFPFTAPATRVSSCRPRADTCRWRSRCRSGAAARSWRRRPESRRRRRPEEGREGAVAVSPALRDVGRRPALAHVDVREPSVSLGASCSTVLKKSATPVIGEREIGTSKAPLPFTALARLGRRPALAHVDVRSGVGVARGQLLGRVEGEPPAVLRAADEADGVGAVAVDLLPARPGSSARPPARRCPGLRRCRFPRAGMSC